MSVVNAILAVLADERVYGHFLETPCLQQILRGRYTSDVVLRVTFDIPHSEIS